MALVKCSAVGRSRTKISCNVIQWGLFAESISAQVRVLESMAVLVTFGDKDDMEVLLEKYLELFKVWFEALSPYSTVCKARQVRVLVWLSEVLLYTCHNNMFRLKKERWVKFIAVDKSTYRRERFDQAFTLVEANSILETPARASIEAERIVFIVCVSIVGVEDKCLLEQYLKDKKEMKVGGKKT
ncbi:Uncharacterized protein TCM_012137 [Theobroma cacao]|uniref:Uncharacterized protein n=1 Tax=Theobroma cacao TaxID=3641 RepID=A0A061FUP5_THECC|nr:Uncharacterized protein TCM_012137 [Theobroma cacao]